MTVPYYAEFSIKKMTLKFKIHQKISKYILDYPEGQLPEKIIII